MLSAFRRAIARTSVGQSWRGYSVLTAASTSSDTPVLKVVPPPETPVYITLSHLLPVAPTAEEQTASLDPSVFNHPIRRDILYLCVNHYRDSLRQGTASTKTRGEVRGSGRKLRPQKGTGKARLGDGQSPMLKGGGVAFGPKPRSFATDLPRKVRQMGMRVALSEKIREHSLGVVPSLKWPGDKTVEFAKRVEELGWQQTLFVAGADKVPPRLERVCRNMPNVHIVPALQLNVFEMLRWKRLVLDIEAVSCLERLLSKNIPESERITMPSPPDLRFSRMEAGRRKKTSPHIEGLDEERSAASGGALFE